MLRRLALFILSYVVLTGSAAAVTLTFTDRSAFQAAAGNLATEGFNFNFGGAALNVGAFTVIGNPNLATFPATTSPEFVSEGSHALVFREVGDISIIFSTPITAVGFDINDINQSAFNYADNAGNSFSDIIPPIPTNTIGSSFFGVVSDTPFSTVVLSTSFGSEFFLAGLDNLQYSTPQIPLPGSVWMMLAGLGGLLAAAGHARQRRAARFRLI